MIKAVFFDLDGTLLPMNEELFTKIYFSNLAKKVSPLGYQPDLLIKYIWASTRAVIKNDGTDTNENVFWNCFNELNGKDCRKDEWLFTKFYQEDFHLSKQGCGFNPKACQTVKLLKEKGYQLVLATNPIFPSIATKQRIQWAGLEENDFDLYTTYENSKHSKPNLDYYRDLLGYFDLEPQNVIMVGNDVSEDMVAQKLGMKVFLIVKDLINKENVDISQYPHGDFDDFLEYLETI